MNSSICCILLTEQKYFASLFGVGCFVYIIDTHNISSVVCCYLFFHLDCECAMMSANDVHCHLDQL